MTARCPSDLALEAYLLEPKGSPLARHLAECPKCTARLAEMRAQGEEFLQYVYPATVEAVEAAAAPAPWWRRRWLALVPTLAAAAAVAFMLRPVGPPDDYVGEKGGGGLGLSVFVQGNAGARSVRDGEAIRADAALRFRVRAQKACRLWILSLDEKGQVSRLYPAEGTGGAAVSGQADIPGGAVLDGQSGPERIWAVCTPTPATWKSLAKVIQSATGPGPEGVRTRPPTTSGLPPGTVADSVLLEKRS
jgi:anti-sigma factor RsiW